MLNNDEIITYICIILSFINISILFYVYFIDKNKIQYLFYIFNIFIFFLIIFIIYFSMQQNNKENIIEFNVFYYLRIILIILNLICFSFYIKYFLTDNIKTKKIIGGGDGGKLDVYSNKIKGGGYTVSLAASLKDLALKSNADINTKTFKDMAKTIVALILDTSNYSSALAGSKDKKIYNNELISLFITYVIHILQKPSNLQQQLQSNYNIDDSLAANINRHMYNYLSDEIILRSYPKETFNDFGKELYVTLDNELENQQILYA